MDNEINIDYASKWTRFFNYLIDTAVFWILWIGHVFMFEDSLRILSESDNIIFNIIYMALFYIFYHMLFELLFGRTIGKMLTGTQVLSANGNKPTMKSIIIRNFSRVIPLNQLSFLMGKTGWHDLLSKTIVVNT